MQRMNNIPAYTNTAKRKEWTTMIEVEQCVFLQRKPRQGKVAGGGNQHIICSNSKLPKSDRNDAKPNLKQN